jgi:hypothetical protein
MGLTSYSIIFFNKFVDFSFLLTIHLKYINITRYR